jgi:hypothetical protein
MSVPRRQKLLKAGVIVVMLIGAAGALEVALRANGERPWDPRGKKFGATGPKVEPGGILFQRDPRLGYSSLPGTFTVTQGKLKFRATNLDRMHRAVYPPGVAPPPGPREPIWIFGDSSTYGWGIDDEDTYAGVLQQRHPEFDVQNFAVGGYSTTQSLIELEDAFTAGARPAKVAFLAYASHHDGRNMMLRGNRKDWSTSLALFPELPAARLNRGVLEYGLEPIRYTPWPLVEHSALINFVETKYNKSQVLTHHAAEVSQALIARFAELCKQHGVDFVLAGITRDSRTKRMLSWGTQQGWKTVDISVDMNIPENALSDRHPGKKVHVEFAQKLERFLPRTVATAP